MLFTSGIEQNDVVVLGFKDQTRRTGHVIGIKLEQTGDADRITWLKVAFLDVATTEIEVEEFNSNKLEQISFFRRLNKMSHTEWVEFIRLLRSVELAEIMLNAVRPEKK